MVLRPLIHIAVLALSIGAALYWLRGQDTGFAEFGWQTLIIVAVLYLVAHVVRALRLAVLASRLLAISGRSSALLHFVTGPGASVLPLKTGEALRLHQLWHLGRSLPGAVLVILMERLFDGVMLLILLAVAYGLRAPLGSGATILFVMTSGAVMVALVVFVIGPGIFAALQRYVVVNHRNASTIAMLGHVDALRQMTQQGAALLRAQGGVLLVLSLAVWGLEVTAATVLMMSMHGGIGGVLTIVEGIFAGPGVWAVLGVVSLCAVWPLALAMYLPRVPAEPLRARPEGKGRFAHVD